MHRIAIGILVAAGVTAASNAQCCSSDGPCTVNELLTRSQLAFRGEVTKIRYANSLPASDAPAGIPHTFVTYRVDRVLRGAVSSEEITLRFMGGWDPTTSSYLHVSLAPEFDLGDEDILFVRGNGSLGAPLVGNRAGRLRISNEQVYSDTGRAVRIDASGHVALGERFSLPEVGSVSVLDRQIWIGLDPDAKVGPSDAIGVDLFAEAVARAAARVPAPAAPFANAPFGEPFESAFPAPSAMPERIESKTPAAVDTEALEEILADESGLADEYLRELDNENSLDR